MTYRLARVLPLLTALCLPACIIDLSGDLDDHIGRTCIGVDARLETITVDEPIHAVVVDSGVGNIDVATHAEPGARVEAKLFGAEPGRSWLHVEDGVLRVGLRCDGCCGGNLTIHVPDTARLEADLGSGDVEVSGLSEAVDVHVHTGNIDLSELSGTLDLHVDSGNIEGNALAGPAATAYVDTGNVSLAFEPQAPLESLAVEADTGNVDLRIPRGTYELELQTGVGNVSVDEVRHDTGADRRVSVELGTGNIDVHGH